MTFTLKWEYPAVSKDEVPVSVENAISRIRAWAVANSWRPSRYAKEAGLHDNTLRGLDSDTWNPTAETLRKLEAVIPPGWQPGDEIPPHPDPLPGGEREKGVAA